MTALPARVGIVGTGEMGRPLTVRLLAAGYDVAAYARRPEVRDDLHAAGVAVVDTPSALGADSDVVVLYVFDDEQVRRITIEDGLLDSMTPGSTLVIHTTGCPATAREIAAQASRRSIGVLDAAGSGGPAQVADGTLNLFVGGDKTHVERCRPMFESYASTITHFGPVGAGQMVKLINNLLFGSHLQLALEAGRLAAEFGIDEGHLASVLHTCSGQSYSLDLVATMGSSDVLVQAAGRFIHKDLVVARDVVASIGASLGTIDAVIQPLLERTRSPDHRSEPRP